ncbi:MAG: SDR family NAD(P)-dependent oxidoreductase [Bacteroidota bacterium]
MSKTILITGSNTGIGLLAAIQIAKAGHQVYVHARNGEKLAATIQEVRSQSGNEHIAGFVADLSDLTQVRAMAQQITEQLPQLDVLINNAGVFNSPQKLNADGLDLRYVVNYLAPYLLTKELLPLLQKSTAPRVINLSSAAQAPVDHAVMAGKAQASERQTYAQSKLALTQWSVHLAKTQPELFVVPVNPGSLLNTRMVREAFGQHWGPADKGATILRELVLNAYPAERSGAYYDNDQGSFGHAHADAYQDASQLIAATEDLIGG